MTPEDWAPESDTSVVGLGHFLWDRDASGTLSLPASVDIRRRGDGSRRTPEGAVGTLGTLRGQPGRFGGT